MTTVIAFLFTLIFWALVIMTLDLSIRRHSNRLALAADALGCGWFVVFAVTLAILILNWE